MRCSHPGAIGQNELSENSVATINLQQEAVTAEKISQNQINTGHIITANEIGQCCNN